MLTPKELNRLKRIAARVRAATPGLTFSVEEESGLDEDTGEPWAYTYGLVRTAQGRVITSVGKDYVGDGELFASARSDELFMLQLIRQLLDADAGDSQEEKKTG